MEIRFRTVHSNCWKRNIRAFRNHKTGRDNGVNDNRDFIYGLWDDIQIITRNLGKYLLDPCWGHRPGNPRIVILWVRRPFSRIHDYRRKGQRRTKLRWVRVLSLWESDAWNYTRKSTGDILIIIWYADIFLFTFANNHFLQAYAIKSIASIRIHTHVEI